MRLVESFRTQRLDLAVRERENASSRDFHETQRLDLGCSNVRMRLVESLRKPNDLILLGNVRMLLSREPK
jgi:hypothetical protein